MRKFIIDTDTGSDDALAIIMALRSNIEVVAITTVAGNVNLKQATINAKVSIEMAGTYSPPIYLGAEKPLERDLVTSTDFHGVDGMGNLEIIEPDIPHSDKPAVEAMIDLINQYPNEIELIAIGPLTNIAELVTNAPNVINKIKNLYIMGGNGFGPGNFTDYAEFNFFVDAEAAKIVFESTLKPVVIGWDVSLNDSYCDEQVIDEFNQSIIGQFTVNANQSIIEFNQREFNKTGFVLPDPAIMAVALDETLIDELVEIHSEILLDPYGHQLITSSTPNTLQVKKMNQDKFIRLMMQLIR